MPEVNTCNETTMVLECVWRCLPFCPLRDRTSSCRPAICLFRLLMSWINTGSYELDYSMKWTDRIMCPWRRGRKNHPNLFHNVSEFINFRCFVIKKGLSFGNCRCKQIELHVENSPLWYMCEMARDTRYVRIVSFSNLAKVLLRSLPIRLLIRCGQYLS